MNSRILLSLLCILAFTPMSCQHSLPQYLSSQGLQQGAMYLKAQPIKKLLGTSQISPTEEKYLRLSLDVMDFAKTKLGMKTGRAYQNYSRLQQKAVTWVVVAAKKEALQAHLFNYPVLGPLPYRGYFRESDAESFAKILKEENLDVIVRPVRAYSSTGWLADPILTTMFGNEIEFIELLFHELLHLQFYWPGQADFNEAFATWFSQKATIKFLSESEHFKNSRSEQLSSYATMLEQDRKGLAATQVVIDFADTEYKKVNDQNLEKIRQSVFSGVKKIYRDAGLEKYAESEWNNARIVSLSTYLKLVPEIENEFKKSEVDFKTFSQQVAKSPAGQWPPQQN